MSSKQSQPQHFAIIGLGGFGYHLALSLAQSGVDVIAIDRQLSLVEGIKDDVTRSICLDSSKKDNLIAVSADKLDVAVVTIGENDLEASILTTALLSQLGVPHVIARATNDLHAEILQMVGANEVINPEKDLAQRLASRITQRGLLALVPLSEDGVAISEIAAPEAFFSKSIVKLGIRTNYEVNIIAIKRTIRKFEEDGSEHEEETTQHNPGPNALIQPGDVLVCVGHIDALERIATLN